MVEGTEPRNPAGFRTPVAAPGRPEHQAGALAPGDLASDGLSSDRQGWSRQGLIAAVFLAILLAVYWGILRDLVWQWWDDESYSHGFLVPFFSAFLIWRRRRELQALPARGTW